MPCKHCGKQHAAPTTDQAADLLMEVVTSISPGPREGAVMLAVTLGRLCETFGLDIGPALRMANGAFDLARSIPETPLPPRPPDVAC